MKYYCPIVLRNKTITSFQLSEHIEIRKMSKEQREEFFGLKKLKFVFTKNFPLGYIAFSKFWASKTNKGRCPYTPLLNRGHFDGSSDILASNYVVVIESEDQALNSKIEQLNLAFRLLQPTSTGIYLCFRESETDVHFHWDQTVHGVFNYLMLAKRYLIILRRIFQDIERNKNDEKFNVCSDLYVRALSPNNKEIFVKYLLLVIALESLFLPSDRDAELSFRLRLFAAKVIGRQKGMTVQGVFNTVKQIYNVRSEIMHKGHTKKLTADLFYQLTEFVRISLNIYLRNKDMFSRLEAMCLK